MTLAEVAAVLDEDLAPGDPGGRRGHGPRRPGADRLHLGNDRRAARRRARLPLPRSGSGSRRSTGSAPRDGELAWCTTATGWSKSARNVFLAPWLTGAAAVIHDGRFDPAERLELIEALGVNVLCQAPTEYRMLAKRAALRPLPSLRRMVSAGEPLNPEVIERLPRGHRPRVGRRLRPDRDRPGHREPRRARPVRDGSMGRPLPGIETRIVPTDGELQLRRAPTCPTFFSRYLGRRAASRASGGATGDLVREDEDGYLYFEGRDDDIILSSGYRIGPFEVESALLSHPAVAEAAAVAAPDPERGSVVRAIVVLRDGEPARELARELQEHCKRRPPPTSSRASSSSPTSCRRQPAARSSGPSCARAARLHCQPRMARHGSCRWTKTEGPTIDPKRIAALTEASRSSSATAPGRSAETYRARGQGDAERRPLLLPGERPLARLHRARRGQPRLGRGRQPSTSTSTTASA